MPHQITNLETQADYTDTLTLGPLNFAALQAVVFNNPCIVQPFIYNSDGEYQSGDWHQEVLALGTIFLTNCGGLRFKTNPDTPTKPARIVGIGWQPAEPQLFPAWAPTGTLGADGSFTPFSGGGGGGAAAIRALANSWYGCGDNSTLNGSVVKNYGSGPDAQFGTSGADTPIGGAPPPGTTGLGVTWAIRADGKSLTLPEHTDVYPAAPTNALGRILTQDTLTTTQDFSFNLWAKVALGAPLAGAAQGYTMFDTAAGGLWYTTGIYGRCTNVNFAVGTGMTLGNISGANPTFAGLRPAQDLGWAICDGAGNFQTVSLGDALDDGDYHMITCTFEAATQTMRLYLDGVLFDSAVYAGAAVTLSPGGANAPIIGIGSSSAENFVGLIDEVGVWSALMLTDDQVATLFVGIP